MARHPCEVRAVVVRSAQDGFGVEFLFGNEDERVMFQQSLREVMGTSSPSQASSPGSDPGG